MSKFLSVTKSDELRSFLNKKLSSGDTTVTKLASVMRCTRMTVHRILGDSYRIKKEYANRICKRYNLKLLRDATVADAGDYYGIAKAKTEYSTATSTAGRRRAVVALLNNVTEYIISSVPGSSIVTEYIVKSTTVASASLSLYLDGIKPVAITIHIPKERTSSFYIQVAQSESEGYANIISETLLTYRSLDVIIAWAKTQKLEINL